MQAHDAGVLSLSLLIVLLPLSITTGALACRIILHRSAPAAIFLIFNAFFTAALLITALALAVLSVGRKQAHALSIKIISLAILFALWLAACVFAQLKLQLSAADSQAEARLIKATRATAWTSFALVTLALGAALLSTRLTNSTESTRTDVEAKGSLNGSSSATTQPTEKETHEETVDSGRNYTPSQSSASVSSSILGIFNPTRRRQHNGASEGRAEEQQDGELQEEEGEDWEIVDMDDVAVPPASGAELTQQSNGARVVGRRGFKGKLGGRKPSPLPPPGTALPALPPTTTTTQPQQQLPNSGSASTFVGSAVALTVPKTVGGTSSSSASYSHTELGLDGDSGSPNISIGQQSSSIHTGNGNGNGGGRARGMSILRLPQSLKALAHPHPHQNSESRPSTANESENGVGVGARKIEPNPHLQPQEFGAGSGAPESPNMVAY